MTFTLTSQGDARSVSKSKDFLWVMIRTLFLGVNLSWMSILVELSWVIINQLVDCFRWIVVDDLCFFLLDDSVIWVNLSFVSFGRKYELLEYFFR